jgi:hypothetical protein
MSVAEVESTGINGSMDNKDSLLSEQPSKEVVTLPSFLVQLQARLDKQSGDEEEIIQFEARSPRGLFIDEINIRRVVSTESEVRWIIFAGPHLPYKSTAALYASSTTLATAWQVFKTAFGNIGCCTTCEMVVFSESACNSCAARESLVVERECTICNQNSHHFYRLLCDHEFCRNCLKRCTKKVGPHCRAPFQLQVGMREESEPEYVDYDESGDDDDMVGMN